MCKSDHNVWFSRNSPIFTIKKYQKLINIVPSLSRSVYVIVKMQQYCAHSYAHALLTGALLSLACLSTCSFIVFTIRDVAVLLFVALMVAYSATNQSTTKLPNNKDTTPTRTKVVKSNADRIQTLRSVVEQMDNRLTYLRAQVDSMDRESERKSQYQREINKRESCMLLVERKYMESETDEIYKLQRRAARLAVRAGSARNPIRTRSRATWHVAIAR